MATPWTSECIPLAQPGCYRIQIAEAGTPVSFARFLFGLSESVEARVGLLEAWRSVPFAGFVWELPALSASRLGEPFESVVTDEPALVPCAADGQAFRAPFASAPPGPVAVEFANLSGDARLIAPRPVSSPSSSSTGPSVPTPGCAHLAVFAREAPLPLAHAVLTLLGRVALREIAARPRWLSTSGLGVPWLHFRIDERPKYYQYLPYCRADFLPRAPGA